MIERIKAYIREHGLMRAGDRVGVAVSGGADSVALLRILLELRGELGIVLSVVHFHHGIRGKEADDDQAFVEALAREHGLECHVGRGDAPEYAREHHLSLEAAARELRQNFFADLLEQHATRIATAHTEDDQAETVLMRIIRGSWTDGLAGIYPTYSPFGDSMDAALVRPLLPIRRAELRHLLHEQNQSWREDSSNRDLAHLRNRLRHELLPLLERDYNPQIAKILANLAEISRGEEEFWETTLRRSLDTVPFAFGAVGMPLMTSLPIPRATQGDPHEAEMGTLFFDVDRRKLQAQPVALQRRALRMALGLLSVPATFELVERVRRSANGPKGKRIELPGGRIAIVEEELVRLCVRKPEALSSYSYPLPVPGEVAVTELGTVIRASLDTSAEAAGYNPAQLWRGKQLLVRNWRAGDRFRPVHTKSEKKLKELLQRLRLDSATRAVWPVVASGETIVWVRGLPPAADAAGVRIEEFGPSPSSL